MSPTPLYNETHQSRGTAPTAYENLLGDAIERAFAAGIHDLDALVRYLTESGQAAPDGKPWSAQSFQQEMARLSN